MAGQQYRLNAQPSCSLSGCAEFEGLRGITQAFIGVSAQDPLRFIWEVPGGGRLIPALRVQRNEVLVNYR